MKKSREAGDEPQKPYGFVLILRGLARAAIRLDSNPAALRVLCVAAEYMNQDGVCKVSQDTIAARLNISRQAVNRHLALLDEFGVLAGYRPKDGILKRYALDTEGLEEEREGQKRVESRRKSKRAAKSAFATTEATQVKEPVAPAEMPSTFSDIAPPTEFVRGDSVFHQKFGCGRVEVIDGNKLTVLFEKAGEKKVVDSFVERLPKDATSDVAGGATQ